MEYLALLKSHNCFIQKKLRAIDMGGGRGWAQTTGEPIAGLAFSVVAILTIYRAGLSRVISRFTGKSTGWSLTVPGLKRY